jgi:ParB-like chromosome segregation protein Spo0J
VEIKLSDLKFHPMNPREWKKQDVEDMIQSLQEFPEMLAIRPIIIDEDGFILGGNMKKQAFHQMGKKTIPAAWVKKVEGLTDEKKLEFIIKDNTHFGKWDWDEINNNWGFLSDNNWGLDIPGVDFGEELDEEQPKRQDNTKNTPNLCPECGQKLPKDDDVPF